MNSSVYGVKSQRSYVPGESGDPTYFYKQSSDPKSLLWSEGGTGGNTGKNGGQPGVNGTAHAGSYANAFNPQLKQGSTGQRGQYDNGLSQGGIGGDTAREGVTSNSEGREIISSQFQSEVGMRSSVGACNVTDSKAYIMSHPRSAGNNGAWNGAPPASWFGGYFGLGGYRGQGRGCNYAGTDKSDTTTHGIYGGGGGGSAPENGGNGGAGLVAILAAEPPSPPPEPIKSVSSTTGKKPPMSMSQLACRGGHATFSFPNNWRNTGRREGYRKTITGVGGWSYGYSKPGTRQVVIYDAAKDTHKDNVHILAGCDTHAVFPFIASNGHIHPHTDGAGNYHNIIKWVAPYTGKAEMFISVNTIHHACGNGIIFWVGRMKSRSSPANGANVKGFIFGPKDMGNIQSNQMGYNTTRFTGNSNASNIMPHFYSKKTINVTKGECFYFVCGPNSSPICDSTAVQWEIAYQEGTVDFYNTYRPGADFHGISLRHATEECARGQVLMPNYRHGQNHEALNKFSDRGTLNNVHMSDFLDTAFTPQIQNTGWIVDTNLYHHIGNGGIGVTSYFSPSMNKWWTPTTSTSTWTSNRRLTSADVMYAYDLYFGKGNHTFRGGSDSPDGGYWVGKTWGDLAAAMPRDGRYNSDRPTITNMQFQLKNHNPPPGVSFVNNTEKPWRIGGYSQHMRNLYPANVSQGQTEIGTWGPGATPWIWFDHLVGGNYRLEYQMNWETKYGKYNVRIDAGHVLQPAPVGLEGHLYSNYGTRNQR